MVPTTARTIGREQLGRFLAACAARELRTVHRHLDSRERVEVVALVADGWRGRLAIGTDRRLLLYAGGLVTGRERVESHAWSELSEVRADALRLVLGFGARRRGLHLLRRTTALADLARRQLPGGRPAAADLLPLARRKLGRRLTRVYRAELSSLPDRLQPGEEVQRLAVVDLDHAALAAVTDRRLLVLRIGLRARDELRWSVAREDVHDATPAGRGLRLDTTDGPVDLTLVLPPERRDELAAVLGAPR